MSSATKVTPVPKGAWKWLLIITLIPLILWMTISPPKFMNTPASSGSEQTPGVSSTPDYEPFQIPLLGEDVLSEPVNMFTVAPPGGWRVRWDGPSSALAHWDDGSVGPLTQYWGAKGGEVRFSGPAGEAVTIYVLPPS